MSGNLFVTQSSVPPSRWSQAFSDAQVVRSVPAGLAAGTLVWLHNALPPAPGAPLPAATPCIVLHDEPSDEKGLAALSAGAAGYANAHATPQLLQTIAAVVKNGGLWVGESLLGRLTRTVSQAITRREEDGNNPTLASLSEREREVAILVARGANNKEIARELDIAERTVKAHLSAVFDKLGVRDRLHLAIVLGKRETVTTQ